MSEMTPQTIVARAKELRDRDGGRLPASFQSALERFEALPEEQRIIESEAYQKLAAAIEQAPADAEVKALVPVKPLADDQTINRPRFLFNLLMVCISIAIMIVVAQLSMFYEDGKSLLVDLKAFQSQRLERRISQLERQLIYARTDAVGPVIKVGAVNPQPPAEGTPAGDQELTNALALERYYDLFFDLKDADRVVTSLLGRAAQFWDDSANPAPILTPIVVPIQRWLGPNYKDEYAKIVANSGQPPQPPDPCANYSQIQKNRDKAKGTMWFQLIADGGKACQFFADNRMKNFALALPSMQEHINNVEAKLKPYSVWILPVSFAIFGAMMFYMRLILNEHLPTPSLSRVLHRVALSAVAAVVLSLFWSSLISPNGEFEAVGFTVFTLAFVIGFSIDIFFSYLDRTVAVAVGVIEKGETESEKGKSLAAAANG